MSHVMCNYFYFYLFFLQIGELVGGGSVINGANPIYFFYLPSLPNQLKSRKIQEIQVNSGKLM